MAPPVENKYGKKKRKKKSDDDDDDNKEEDDEKSEIPKLYEIEVDFEEIVVDVCIEMLLTLHESWEGRVSILNTLINQLCDEDISDDIYALKICKFLHAVGHQFTDPRSLIIQALEECISRLAKTTPDKFIVFAPFILRACFNTFPVRIEALRDPGVKLGQFLVKTMMEYDTNHVLLRTVFDGLNSKQAAIRTECADYIDLMIRNIGLLEKEDSNEEEKELLNFFDDSVYNECIDSSAVG